MFGREQEQAGVLVETAPDQTFDPSDTKALAEFRNKLWYGFYTWLRASANNVLGRQ